MHTNYIRSEKSFHFIWRLHSFENYEMIHYGCFDSKFKHKQIHLAELIAHSKNAN